MDKRSPLLAQVRKQAEASPIISHVLTTKGAACHRATPYCSGIVCVASTKSEAAGASGGNMGRREKQPASSFTPVSDILHSPGNGSASHGRKTGSCPVCLRFPFVSPPLVGGIPSCTAPSHQGSAAVALTDMSSEESRS